MPSRTRLDSTASDIVRLRGDSAGECRYVARWHGDGYPFRIARLMVGPVGIHVPEIVLLAEHIPRGQQARKHRMVLVVVAVHPVAPDGLEIRKTIEPAADHIEMPA